MMTNNIDARFDYRTLDAETRKRRVQMGKKIKTLATELDALLADGWEKKQALLRLEETMMWANAAIAREGK
ncbi:Acb2/Tad1 domain-containing protein [Corynebacterium matruchotii]